MALFDCSEKHQEESKKHLPKTVVADGYHVNRQSIKPPTVVEVKDVKNIIAGTPIVIGIKPETIEPNDFITFTIGEPDSICVPGQAPHQFPETFPAAGEKVTVKSPDVVIANPPGIVEFINTSYNSYNSRQGLKSNIVATLYNDSKGNIWIGTWGGGVDIFNGQTFSNYSKLQGISNSVIQIVEDNNGNMWFSTSNGLNIFDGKTITSFSTIPGLKGSIPKLLKDREGNIWISVWDAIYKYDGETFYRFSNKQGLLFQSHTDIVEDKNGNLWIKTINGFCKYDRKSFAHYINPEITWMELKAVLHDDDLRANTSLKIEKNRYSNLISNPTATYKGLFIYDDDKGLYKYENGAITHLGLENGLNGANLIEIREDNTGHLWIASNGGGIAKSNGHIFSHITTKEGLSNQNIRSIGSDNKGNIWIGTWEGGLNKYDGTSISRYSTEQGLTANTTHAIFNDKKENIWLGTWGNGVDIFDGKTFTNYSAGDGLAGNFIFEIMEDSKGNIWFATTQGASKFNGKTFTSYRTEQGLSANEISCILEDSKKNIWFGSMTNGITKFDGESFVQYTTASGLSDNAINSLMEDDSGNVWIGTYNRGVIKFDGHTFTHFTMDNGLPNNCVWAILQDKNGYIWFGTSNGLCRMNNFQDKSSFRNLKNESESQVPVFKNYLVSDGFLGVGTLLNCLIQDTNGTIWIGANDRISTYHPEWDKTDTIPPFVQITGISLFNERIDWLELEENQDTILILNDGTTFKNFEFTEVSKWNYIPEQLKLRYNNNFITFEFVGITSNKPDHVKYQYFLEGFDKNWSPLTKVPNATYTSLPHGKYTFNIKAVNSDGIWSDNYIYSIFIKPPFWYTWWAYIIYIIVFFIGIWMVHVYMKKRTIQKERQKTQKRELEHAKEIEKAYQNLEVAHENLKSTQAQLIQSEKMASLGELTAGIAHEIQNPLNFVNNFSEISEELVTELKDELNNGDLEEAIGLSDDVIHNLQKIKLHGRRASDIVKGMLQHSRSGIGTKEPTDINALADEYLRLSYHGLRAKDKSFNADFKTNFDPSLPKINVIPQDIGRVLLNLINNAFYAVNVETRHALSLQQTPPQPQPNYKPMVIVSTKNTGPYVEISIKDNGPGIPAEIKDKIFQPFFTTKPTGQGTGLGLSLSYDIIKAHSGELKVETTEGKGSDFVILLPV
jgi:signal transduction histidine kinase/ligand-binding sensor domain-containing protein